MKGRGPSRAASFSSRGVPRRLKPAARVGSFILCLHLACVAPALADENDLYARIAAANEAFAQGRFDDALTVYESAAQGLGDSPALDYNRAAAKYKLGDHAGAAELFSRAAMAPDAELSRRAKFAWGNCDYASALATLQKSDPQSGQQPDFQGGIEKLQSAIRHYRDALASEGELPPDHPGDRAARENIERAQRLVDAIKEFLEQQQQQQNQDQQQEQKDQQQNKQKQDQQQEQQKQQEQQQNQQSDEQEQQEQQSPDQQQEEQEQQQQGQQQEEAEQKQEQQKQQEAQQQEQQSAEQQEQTQQQQAQAQQLEAREMTPEEVEALLQAVRDKEKMRRQEQVQRMRARRAPVIRDW